MTEIDVPDWVVQEALSAKLPNGERVRYTIRSPFDETIMRAALTAALGAWVVPESVQFQDPDGKQWWNFNGPESCRYAESLLWPKRTLYTLAQDKP